MASLSQFSRRIVVLADRIPGNVNALVRKVALAADQALVFETPVDTGRARSNWLVQLGSAPGATIEAYVPGEEGSTAAANSQAALDQAEAVINGYNGGVEIHITNNLPYIEALNAGSSPQAPANFVQIAILEASQVVQYGRILKPRPGSA